MRSSIVAHNGVIDSEMVCGDKVREGVVDFGGPGALEEQNEFEVDHLKINFVLVL